mgnify:CR=1 FL=1
MSEGGDEGLNPNEAAFVKLAHELEEVIMEDDGTQSFVSEALRIMLSDDAIGAIVSIGKAIRRMFHIILGLQLFSLMFSLPFPLKPLLQ